MVEVVVCSRSSSDSRFYVHDSWNANGTVIKTAYMDADLVSVVDKRDDTQTITLAVVSMFTSRINLAENLTSLWLLVADSQ